MRVVLLDWRFEYGLFQDWLNISQEHDYDSNEVSAEYLHWLDKSKNQAISFGASYQKNKIKVLCSLNNSSSECDSSSGASEASSEDKDISVINSEIGFTQVIDKTSLIKTSLFYSYEDYNAPFFQDQ